MQDGYGIAAQQRWHSALGRKPVRDRCVDLGTRQIAELAAIKFNIEHLKRAPGLPEMVGDDADGFETRQLFNFWMLRAGILVGERDRRYPHDRTHARHPRDVRLVADRHHRSGERGRHADCTVQHSGYRHVDAEGREPVAFRRCVQPRDRLSDHREVPRILERWIWIEC